MQIYAFFLTLPNKIYPIWLYLRIFNRHLKMEPSRPPGGRREPGETRPKMPVFFRVCCVFRLSTYNLAFNRRKSILGQKIGVQRSFLAFSSEFFGLGGFRGTSLQPRRTLYPSNLPTTPGTTDFGFTETLRSWLPPNPLFIGHSLRSHLAASRRPTISDLPPSSDLPTDTCYCANAPGNLIGQMTRYWQCA